MHHERSRLQKPLRPRSLDEAARGRADVLKDILSGRNGGGHPRQPGTVPPDAFTLARETDARHAVPRRQQDIRHLPQIILVQRGAAVARQV